MVDTTVLGVPATGRREEGALLLLCMAQFMLVLDVAIVNVALPRIQTELHFSQASLQFVVTAYVLTFGGLLLFGGRASDVFGRRRIFVVGLALFTLSSIACGLAQSAPMLIVSRALQGVGGALVSPAALSLLITIFPEGARRNRALGIWSAMAASGGAAGLLLGGVLTDFTSWRLVFLINGVLGTAVIVGSLWLLPRQPEVNKGRIDGAGACAITVGLIALVYGLQRGGQDGFASPIVLALLAVAILLIVGFVVIEQRAKEPLIQLGLFRLPTLTGANLATLLLSGVILGVNYFLTLYFQQVQGYSPLQTGLAFLPMTVASALASQVASRFLDRTGIRLLLLIGMLALAAGSLLLAQLKTQSTFLLPVLPGMLLIATGLGFGFTLGTLAATAGVPEKQQGVASGLLATSQQLGGALGLALLSTVAGLVTGTATSKGALTDGFNVAFYFMVGFSLIATLVVALLVREQDCQEERDRRISEPDLPLVSSSPQSACCQPAVTQLAISQEEATAQR